jgi:UDP-2-acetamido-3-amino-2,3-dideoxy-glucuronate N-acetyltransferase
LGAGAMTDSVQPEYLGHSSSPEDRMPFFEPGVRVGTFTALGRQPYPTAANCRKAVPVGAGRIGSGSVIGCLCVVYAGVFIGREVCVGDHAVIRENTRIGDRCVIGTKVDIQYNVTIADDVKILNETQIAGGSVIGRGSFIGPGVQTANDPHIARHSLEEYKDRGQVGVTIGEYVFVGVGAILLPGVTIGDRAIISAGAVVTRDVPEGVVIVASGVRGHNAGLKLDAA